MIRAPSRWVGGIISVMVVVSAMAFGQGRPVGPRELANVVTAREIRQRAEAGDPQGIAAAQAKALARASVPPPPVNALRPVPSAGRGADRREGVLQALGAGEDPAVHEAFLEVLVARNPFDREARSWLLRLAERRGDQVALQRHRVHLLQTRENFPWWKWGLAGLVLAGIVWQAYALWQDWRQFQGRRGQA